VLHNPPGFFAVALADLNFDGPWIGRTESPSVEKSVQGVCVLLMELEVFDEEPVCGDSHMGSS